MKIKVAQHHIDLGERYRGEFCPVARAMADAGLSEPVVDGEFCWWNDYGKQAALPEDAVRFVAHFDDGLPVEPLEFEIEEMEPVQ